MVTPNSPIPPETRPQYWRRVLRPLLWWLLLVLVLYGIRTHQRLMEQTRIGFSIAMQGNDVSFAATVKLDGQPVGCNQKIALGNHTLSIIHPKAESFITNFFGWYGGRDFGRINLQRAKGTLMVSANPPAHRISITGPEFSCTLSDSAGTNVTVPTDDYQIRAFYPHWSQSQNTAVFDRQSAACIFSPQFGTLHLACNRDGATYELKSASGQNVESGDLPAIIPDLLSERYQVTITYHNRRLQKSLFLKTGVTNEMPIEFVLGEARLETEPPGASVRNADGEYLGQTPLELPDLPPQTTQFNLSLSGYEPVVVAVDILADQTNAYRTNLISTRYLTSMQVARQYLAAANYGMVAQATGEALAAKPGDVDALALQGTANSHLNAERQRREQLKLPRLAFNSLCTQNPDASLFREFAFRTSVSAKTISDAIVRSLQTSPHAFDVEYSRPAQTDTYETVAHQTFSLGILGGTERVCLLVVGQAKEDETQIFFKVLEYRVQHVIQANSLFNVTDNKQLIPIHSSRIQMNDALQMQVRDGMQIVLEKIKQVIGQP